MGNIPNFDLNVYSEEFFDFTEEEFASVMRDASGEDFQGYSEWSTELEQGERIDTPHGQILINRECSQTSCKTTRCERGANYGGIAI